MSRNYEGLHARQSRLLRIYLDQRCTLDQALRTLDIRPTLFHKWRAQPEFEAAFHRARQTRAYMEESDPALPASTPAATAPAAAPAAAPTQTTDSAQHQTPSLACDQRRRVAVSRTPAKPSEPKPQLSEREWVRSLNGDKAVEAYDRLVEMHKAYDQAHPNPPDPAPSPENPPTG